MSDVIYQPIAFCDVEFPIFHFAPTDVWLYITQIKTKNPYIC